MRNKLIFFRNNAWRFFILLLLALLFNACELLQFKKPVSENVVARAGSEYLYESDIKGLIASGTPPADSLNIVRNYVNTWIRQQLMVQKAKENINDDKNSFEKQLEEYRNSLIIYHYQTRLLEQALDTSVADAEIEKYYNENMSNFELKDHIVKFAYCKMLEDSVQQIQKIRKILKQDSLDIEEFEKYSAAHAVDFYYNVDKWMYFSDLQIMVPITTFDEEKYLRNNNYIEIKDSPIIYLLRFFDYKIKDGISPLILERENIRDIIINKRKLTFLQKMDQDIYEEAFKNNEIEIY